MILYKLIIFFLLSFKGYIHCIDLITSERTYLLNLVQKVNDTNLNIVGIESLICADLSGCKCDGNGSLTSLRITSTTTNAIIWDDFIGFSKLQKLDINNGYFGDANFIYTPIPTITDLIITSFSTLTLDQKFPNYYHLEITLINNPQEINIKTSCFTNVTEFFTTNLINIIPDGVNYSNDSNLQNLIIYTSNLPNLTFFPNLSIFYSYIKNLNESTFSNILTFNKLRSMVLTFLDGSYDFPIEFSKMKNPQYYSLIIYNGNWKSPSQYIDLSNNQVLSASIIMFNPGLNFNINGSLPFSQFPGRKSKDFGSEFGIYNGRFSLPDFKIFEFTSVVRLDYIRFGGDLPSVKDTLQKSGATVVVSLTNNLFTGTIDESWCSIDLDVSNNLLSGPLPICKYCYQNDPFIINKYIGNNFTNINSNATCTYDQISVHRIIILDNGNSVLLMGKNIGFRSFNVETYPKIIFNKNNGNDSFSGVFQNSYLYSSYDIIQVRFIVPGINFTISLRDTPPIINSHSVTNDTITFTGEYFSYDKSAFNIGIYNGKEILNCQVKSCTFYKIVCKINYPIFQYGVSNGTLTIDGRNQTFRITLTNTTIENGYCDDETNTCHCFSKWTSLYPNQPCLIPNHYTSSSSKVPSTTGGNITLSGWFGDVHNNFQFSFGNQVIKINSIDNETIGVEIPSGIGSKSIQIIQNNITWSGLIYPYSDSTIKCLNNCGGSINGVCNSNGECNCNENYIGPDCSTKLSNKSSTPPPPTQVLTNPDGTTTISNEDTIYLIYIDSITEIDFNNNQVPNSLINLKNGWIIDNDNNNNTTMSSLMTRFYQNVNNISIIMTIESVESNNGKEFTFAGNQFTVSKDGFKLSLSVSNWNYKSNLNTLQIQMSSDVSLTEGNRINQCIDSSNEDTNVETSSNSNVLQNVNYLKISKNGKTLYGRFQDKMLSDGRSTTTITKIISKDDKKVLISLDMPHCNQCLLDPDFSVVINPDFRPSDSCGSTRNKRSWIIPVAVVVPVIGCALIIAGFILTKKILHLRREKNRISLKLKFSA
ncbi:hypothetical protein ACTA71_007157 [Dictyostelium dimigraforme]